MIDKELEKLVTTMINDIRYKEAALTKLSKKFYWLGYIDALIQRGSGDNHLTIEQQDSLKLLLSRA